MSDVRFDFGKFARVFGDSILQLTGVTVRKVARDTVRVDTSALRNSILLDKVGADAIEVSANTEYAAAQEYGRPDLPNYGFTPYMRPGAQAGVDELEENARKAANIAARAAR
jgi:hypothetical protein